MPIEEPYTKLLGGAVGGVHRKDIPTIVGNLLEARQRAVEITVRPEPFLHDHHYTIEWRYLRYDAEAMTWEPVQEQRDNEPSH